MMMNNFERLTQTKSVEDFWKEIQELNSHKLAPFIDFPAFLKSEDANLMHFVKAIGEGELLPSEAEMIMHNCTTENDKLLYQQMHKKSVLILEKTQICGEPHFTICNRLGMMLLKTPASNITQVEMYENTEY